MMKSLLFFYILSFLICLGCKKDAPSVSKEDNIKVQLDSLSKEKITLDILKLSPEAEKDLESFEDFKSLRKIAHTMHTANPFHIKKYADSTDFLIQTFKENLTKELRVNTIKSRIAVLATESGLLSQLSTKENPDNQKLMDANIRLLTAYNSLIIQLNELSLAIPENIEKELLRETNIVKDSVPDHKKESFEMKH